jgi:hypothetical protein
MKKITILSFMMLFCVALMAQNTMTMNLGKTHNPTTIKASKATLNTDKSVIWSDDFSVPANWTIAAGVGSDNWVIGTTGCQGQYAIPTIASTTAANGFAKFDSDFMCGGNEIGNLTTATSHSCTGHSVVSLVFQENYERYYDSTFVYVSNNGTTWTKFPVNKTLAANIAMANPTTVTVNISSVAANQATVWIRFTYYSPSTWMIDDVKLQDLNANDISANKSLFDLDGKGYYQIIPFSQMGIIRYGEDVYNNGSATQTNVVLNANINSSAITANSTAFASMPSGTHDTLWAQPTITTPGVATSYAAKLSRWRFSLFFS